MREPRIVIDTNVVISALKSKRGASSLLLSLAGTELFSIHVSIPLVLEYEEVVTRQKQSLNLTADNVSKYIDAICAVSEQHEIYFLWRPTLRDMDDEAILEIGVKARCDYIVTYNKRDFVGSEQFGISIVTPKEFLQIIGKIP